MRKAIFSATTQSISTETMLDAIENNRVKIIRNAKDYVVECEHMSDEEKECWVEMYRTVTELEDKGISRETIRRRLNILCTHFGSRQYDK